MNGITQASRVVREFRVNPQELNMNFDIHCHALLVAAGYSHEHYPESWEDIGGPENGPNLVGGPAFDAYYMPDGKGGEHEIIVVRGEIVQHGMVPTGPEF